VEYPEIMGGIFGNYEWNIQTLCFGMKGISKDCSLEYPKIISGISRNYARHSQKL
jgi:hypothetical protein